jgi:hypothetical protein
MIRLAEVGATHGRRESCLRCGQSLSWSHSAASACKLAMSESSVCVPVVFPVEQAAAASSELFPVGTARPWLDTRGSSEQQLPGAFRCVFRSSLHQFWPSPLSDAQAPTVMGLRIASLRVTPDRRHTARPERTE